MILRTHNLTKHFPIRDLLGRVEGQVKALDGVTLTLPEGRPLGVVGEPIANRRREWALVHSVIMVI